MFTASAPWCSPSRRVLGFVLASCAALLLAAAPAAAQQSLFDRAFGKDVDGAPFVCFPLEGCQAGSGGVAAADLKAPSGVAVAGGEVYVAETANNRVSVFTTGGAFVRAFGKKVNPAGGDTCTRASGCQPGSVGSGAGGELWAPVAVAVAGNEVFIAESENHRVSVFSTDGAFLRAFGGSVGGAGVNSCSGSGCQGGSSGGGAGQLNAPTGVAVAGGEVYVVEVRSRRVSVFATDGTFQRAFGKDVDPLGGDICTAGSGCQAGSSGGAAGQLRAPLAVAVGGAEVYVADALNERVSVFATAGTFARAFGKGVSPGGGDTCTTASGCQAGTRGGGPGELFFPAGVAVAGGEVFLTDTNNNRVSVFATDGAFDRAFGKNVNPAGGDTCTTATGCKTASQGATAGRLNSPFRPAVADGEVYVADQSNHRVSVFTAAGDFVRAFARGVEPDGPDVCTTASGCKPSNAGAAAGQFWSGYGVAVAGGEVYVSDRNNHRVNVFTTAGAFVRAFGGHVNPGGGNVCTPASGCKTGSAGVTAGQMRFPSGIAVAGDEVYVADQVNHRISVFTTAGAFVRAFGRSVHPGGDLCTAASGCQAGTSGGGAGQLNHPTGVSVADGEVYVGDQLNRRVSVFTTAGAFVRAFGDDVDPAGGDVCTPASGCKRGNTGGEAGQLDDPNAVAVRSSEVYVGEHFNDRVSVFTTAGAFVRAFGGNVRPGGGNMCTATSGCQAGTSGGAAGQLASPMGVAVGGDEIYVGDQFNHRVSVFTTTGTFVRAFGKDVDPAGGDVCTAAGGCQAGPAGGTAGQLSAPTELAVAGGEVYVADGFNNRISVFDTPTPALSRAPTSLAFGQRDVDDGATAEQSSTLTNTGIAAVALSNFTETGDDSQFERLTGQADDCATSTTLAPGQECKVRLRFDPTTTGAKAATLTVDSNAADVTVALNGTGIQTALSASPASLAFGSRDVDDGPAAEKSSTVTNAGTEPVSLSALTMSGDDTHFERLTGQGGDCTTSTTLTAGQTCTVRVRFDPTTTGSKSATLTVTSPNAEAVTVALSGTGIQTALSRSPASLAFGSQDIDDGPTGEQSSTIVNAGTEAVTLTALTLPGDAAHFRRLTGQDGDCTASTTLTAGQTCAVRVRFNPSSTGAKAATLTVESNADDVTIDLSGAGTEDELSRSPGALLFGSRDVDDGPAAAQSSTVTNSGTQPVSFSALTLTGDAAHFERLTGQPGDCTATTTLTAGQSCTVRLRFDPTSTGAKAATLTVDSNVDDVTIALTGRGIQTALSGSPASLTFGSHDVDDASTGEQSSTITNTGTEAVTLTALTLTGDAGHFERLTGEAGDCTATTTLTAGETCAVRFRFDPSSTGAKAATLTVASNAADVTAGLSGTGSQTELSRAPASLSFGSLDVDDGPSTEQASTITNTGSEAVSFTALALTGDDAHFERLTGEAGDCTAATTLGAGETCTLRLRFDPSSTGTKAATLTIDSEAADVTVGLAGTGIHTGIARTPSSLSFGSRDVDEGPSSEQASTVTNTGSEGVTLSAPVLAGDAAHFERLTGEAADCTATMTLAADESCTVRFRFDPGTTGAKAATVTVASSGGDVTIGLSGTGTQTELSTSPTALAFGSRDVDDGPSSAQSSAITNTGTEPVAFGGLTLTGDAAHFERLADQAGDCTAATTLGAGQACTLRLRFDPSSVGAKAAAVELTSAAQDVVVTLGGTATHVDSDGDGVRDSVDEDDDGDGVPDAIDGFPLDPTESVDSDGDRLGNNADPDDDNDGVADAADAFPLDPARSRLPATEPATEPPATEPAPQPAIEPPPIVSAWQLVRRSDPGVTRNGKVLFARTGHAAVCPSPGPACVGKFTLKVLRRSRRTGRLYPLFAAGRAPLTTIAAGEELLLSFRLSGRARRILLERGAITAVLRGFAGRGGPPLVAREARLRVSLPRGG